MTEWKLPGALAAHDTNIYPPTGKFYSVDMFVDDIFVTDPKTNKTTKLPIPPLGVPIGGSFAGQSDIPAYVHNIRHGLHSLELGTDGKFYMTGSIGGNIVVYDPATGEFQSHNVGSNALIPHTPRFDSQGILWFTLYLSNQVGRFDPKTGHTTVIQLPTKIYRKELVDRTTAVYGIDINPFGWIGVVHAALCERHWSDRPEDAASAGMGPAGVRTTPGALRCCRRVLDSRVCRWQDCPPRYQDHEI